VTKAGNAFNGVNQLVQLNPSGYLPALNGSLLTTLDASHITSGTLAVAQGGTGLTGYTTGDLLYASNATTIGKLTAVASGSCLVSAGVGTAPSWGSCGAAGITGIGAYNASGTDTKGASIVSNQLIFQSASASAPGMVDTGDQSFAGNKTFGSSATTQTTLQVNANSLTTGTGLKVATTSTTITGGNLLEVSQSSAYASTFTSSSKLLNVNRSITGPVAGGAIVLDASSTGGSFWPGPGGFASHTQVINHTVGAGSNRVLLVAVKSTNISSVTYTNGGSSSLTLVGSQGGITLWMLIAPTPGAGTITVSSSGTSYITMVASSWTGVDQTTPTGTPVGASGASLSVTSTGGQMIVDAITPNAAATPTAGQTQIGQYDPGNSTSIIASSYKTAGVGSTTMSWSGSVGATILAVPLNPILIAGTTDGTLTGSVANIASSCLGCTEASSILNLQQSNTLATGAVLSLQNSGLGADIQLSSGILRNVTNSTAALSIQNSAGTETLLKADTTNNRIVIGNATGIGANTTTLVLDTAASDPTGVVGAMYYNTTDNVFRCYTTGWFNCSGTGVSVASGSGNDTKIAKFNASGQLVDSSLSETGTTDKTLTYAGNAVINAATGFNGNLLDLQLNGASKLKVTEAGNTTISGTLSVANATTLSGTLGVTGTTTLSGDTTIATGKSLTVNTIQSATSTALTLTGNAASTLSTTAGNLTLQAGSGTVSLGTSTNLTNTAALTIAAGGTNQNLTLQGSGTGSVIAKSTTNSANAFRIQNATGVDVLNVDTTNKSINVGSAATFTAMRPTYGSGFAAAVPYTPSPVNTNMVASGDLDGDGDVDYATSGTAFPNVSVMKNNGNGTFVAGSGGCGAGGPNGISLGDLDGDGDLDLVMTRGASTAFVSVCKNDGTGLFGSPRDYSLGNGADAGGVIVDVDGDGDLDIVARAIGPVARVFKNDGTGLFTASGDYAAASTPLYLKAADVDGDGDKDLVTGNSTSNTISIFKNNGTGSFAAKTDFGAGTNVVGVAVADFDGDGDQDVATANYGSNNVTVRYNDGTGSYATSATVVTGTSPISVAAADIDLDGDKDIVTVNKGSGNVSVLLNDGTGSFPTKNDYATSSSPDGLTVADLDGDADFDLVTVSSSAAVTSVIKNNAITGFSLATISATASITAASSSNPALTLQGATGQAVDILRIQGSTATPFLTVAKNGKVGVGDVMNLADSTYAFNVQGGAMVNGDIAFQNTAATETLLKADTTNNRIVIGNATGTGANTTTLVLDSGTSATPPTGTPGAMYYDTTNNQFMCYAGGTTPGWSKCGGNGVALNASQGTDNYIAKFVGGKLSDSQLSETGTTLTYAGNAVINAASGFLGNLIDLQLAATSKFKVDQAGDVTGGKYNTATISGGTLSSVAVNSLGVSGTTITGSAGLTISAAASGNQNLILQGSGTGVVQVSSALSIQGSASVGQTLTIGKSDTMGSLVLHAGNSFTGTIRVAAGLGQNTVYVLPAVTGTIVEICTSAGNCVPNGNTAGDMLYWNGTGWAIIPAGSNGDTLEFCSGVPVWGGNASVSTTAISSITSSGAVSGGTITGACSGIVERGVVYATTTNPTTANTKVISGATNPYTASISGLSPSTTYYVRAYVTTGNGTVYGSQVSFTTADATVGDAGPGGGIIFYDKGSYSSGWRYLEAAASDQSTGAVWCSISSTLFGASGTAIGTGKTNTTAAAACTSGAIKIAKSYTGGGFTDWFLPSLNEVNQMYVQRAVLGIGNTASDNYWTSSETSDVNAYLMQFSNTAQLTSSKNNTMHVRAVRQF
jgi:hypothetical protein